MQMFLSGSFQLMHTSKAQFNRRVKEKKERERKRRFKAMARIHNVYLSFYEIHWFIDFCSESQRFMGKKITEMNVGWKSEIELVLSQTEQIDFTLTEETKFLSPSSSYTSVNLHSNAYHTLFLIITTFSQYNEAFEVHKLWIPPPTHPHPHGRWMDSWFTRVLQCFRWSLRLSCLQVLSFSLSCCLSANYVVTNQLKSNHCQAA